MTGLAFALPALLGLATFVAVPFLMAVALSFTDMRLGSPHATEIVGLEQYGRILGDPSFRRALLNNGLFALIVVPVQTGLALLLATALNRRLRGIAVYRAAFFMPVVLPMALVAVVWELIFAPGPGGLMNALLDVVTLGAWEPADFLRNEALALPSIMLLSIWQGAGFQMVILLAGLQSIPAVRYEAAAIDGAGPWARFVHVTLPGLRNPLLFTTLVTSILAFRVFDQVQILTRGGPRDATTTVMFETVRAAFERQQLGQASAMTVVFFSIVLTLTLLQRRLLRQRREVA